MTNWFSRFVRKVFPDRETAEHLNECGIDLAGGGDMAAALITFQRALEANPSSAEVWSNLGLCFEALGDPNEACAAHARAASLDPSCGEIFDNWGNALIHLGRLSDSEEKHRKAISLNPGLTSAKAHLGNTLLLMGRIEEGQALLEQSWAEAPSDDLIAGMALSGALYAPELNAQQLSAGHHRWPGAQRVETGPYDVEIDPDRPLRVG